MFSLFLLTSLFSLATSPPTATDPPSTCALYDDSPVGVVCFHGDELTTAIATEGVSWLVQFYSSWCGHCQRFAPTWKQLAEDVAGWSPVVRIGVIDCSAGHSQSTCTGYSIRAYPSIRFFHPGESQESAPNSYHGDKNLPAVEGAIIDHLQSFEGPLSPHWPHLLPIVGGHLLTVPEGEWEPVVVVFEKKESYVGREVTLDLLDLKQLKVYRTLPNNLVLVNHYSILEFPSLVVETRKDGYTVISGHSMADPRREFGERVRRHVRSLPHVLTATTPPTSPDEPLDDEGVLQDKDQGGVLQDDSLAVLQDSLAAVVKDSAGRHTKGGSVRNRVSVVDVLGAVSYILRREVALHSTVTGAAFTTLLRLVHLLESVFTTSCPAAVPSLSLVSARLESRLSSGFITNRDWLRLLDTKLDESVFPRDPEWLNCRGSQSHFRGYPCALWTLSHTLTLLTLHPREEGERKQTHTVASSLTAAAPSESTQQRVTFGSREALKIVSRFIATFFSCEHCREHFADMSRSLEDMGRERGRGGRVMYDGDAVLWLWEAHNTVNRRLVTDISSDPLYPKALFPSQSRCPYCYIPLVDSEDLPRPNWKNTGFRTNSESLLSRNTTTPTTTMAGNEKNLVYAWNRTAVLLYLWNFYHWNHTHGTTRGQVLRAAWPKLFRLSHHHHGQQQEAGLGFSPYDLGLCLTYYLLCGLLLAGVGYWLVRRRLRHRHFRHFLHP